MILDPKTKLASLLTAIPSSTEVLERLEIQARGNEDKTLAELCAERGIPFETFLKGMNEVDWNIDFRP